MPEDTDVLTVVLYSVIAVLVLFSNSIVIIVIIMSQQLHIPTLWNIAVMSAMDLALGLHWLIFVVPSKIVNAFVYPEIYGTVSSQLLLFIGIQNILNIVVALVDRYISIRWPLRYPSLMSAQRFTLAVTSVFLINILQLGIFLSASNYDIVYSKTLGICKPLETNIRMAGFTILAVLIIIGLTIRIRLELGRKRPYSNVGRHREYVAQFTYTMYLSTIIFFVCYIPSAIHFLVTFITQRESVIMMQIGITCILSNSLWNVFIYAATYRPFREAFLKLFFPSFCRERARREVQDRFQRNRINGFTVV